MKRLQIPVALAVALLLAAGPYFVPAAPAATVGPVTDSVGVVRVAKGQPITIAYWLVVAGPDASLGVDSRRGIELAIADKRTVAGFNVRLIGEDSGCNAEGGVTAATKLSANKNIVAAIGSSCSSEAVPGAPILWKAGIVTVSPSNTAPPLTAANRTSGFAGYMRTAHNDLVQGKVAAEFVRNSLKLGRAATIHDGSPYAEGLANAFANNFKRLGGTVTSQEAISPTDTDMRPVLTKIAAGRPEIIYYPIFIAAGGFVTRQAKEVSGLSNTKLMSADGTFSPDFRKAAGDSVVGVYNTSPDLSPEALGPAYTSFVAKHEKKYGEKPISAFHPHAYDAAMIIFRAIERVAKKDSAGNLYIGRKALRDALFATKGYKGLTGTITCTATGDCADPKIAVYQHLSADPAKWNAGTDPKKLYP
ncbi:MAG TPA: branched-chain amino acid ABC transporter substrate-binding protein [bacterium]|nr:branched-chain amino acid ABC transporter substrate-binding protein [bacterium]